MRFVNAVICGILARASYVAVSSIIDIAIASTLAVTGIAMAPIPFLVVAGTLVAAALFALVLDLIKVPVFAHLGIAEKVATAANADGQKANQHRRRNLLPRRANRPTRNVRPRLRRRSRSKRRQN